MQPPYRRKPLVRLRGPSAGGAAAYGWYFALAKKRPDRHLIVIAQIDERGQLVGFEDQEALVSKTRAIADRGEFDKIVVASSNNAKTVEAILRERKKWPSITVETILSMGLESDLGIE